MRNRGKLFIVSGPSGVGKGTVCRLALERDNNVVISVSVTERLPRAGEVDGVNYYFIDNFQFDEMIEKDSLLEWAQYGKYRYGTPRDKVYQALYDGKNVILEIDVQGGLQVKEKEPKAVLIFVMPPDFEVLQQRLRGRGTENEEQIQTRLKRAEEELAYRDSYDYVMVNDKLDTAAEELLKIINKG